MSAVIRYRNPFEPFLPLLKQSSNPEEPIPLLTSSVLTSLISNAIISAPKSTEQIDEALPVLYTYLSSLAKSSDAGMQDIAIQEYSSLLRITKTRTQFWKQRKETLNPLMDILRSAAGASKDTDSTLVSGATSIRSGIEGALAGGVGIQLLYHVLMVVWQLSFEASLVGEGLNE